MSTAPFATWSPAFEEASRAQQAGDFERAQNLYNGILATHPEHPDALHMLGVIASQRGDLPAAVAFIRRAIAANGQFAGFHVNLGVMLDSLGDPSQAVACYERAMALNPGVPEIYSNIAHSLRKLGKPELAQRAARQAVILRGDFADAYNNLGASLHEAGHPRHAIIAYQQAIAIRPNSPDAYNNLGNSLATEPGKTDQAIAAYKKALELKPDFAVVLNNLGKVLLDQNKLQEAAVYLERAVNAKPDFPDALNNYGNALHRLRRLDEAIAIYQQAMAIAPNMADLHNNVGNVYHDQGKLDEAIACFRKALELRPIYVEAFNNLGYAIYGKGDYEQALRYCRRALEINPKFHAAQWNIALILLLLGDFEGGWREYGKRWSVKELDVSRPKLGRPEWDGSPLQGKTILLYPEQGYGDCIQFIRYAPLLQARGARVKVVMPPELYDLFKATPGIDELIPVGKELGEFDVHCPLLSLPSLFGTTLQTIPGGVPYVQADPAKVALWRARMPTDRIKIGISWAGRPTHPNDHNRTMGLQRFGALASVEQTWFCSLQKGPAARECQNPPAGMDLVDWTEQLQTFADTAALICALDLVIAVDTAVCHVAGAMGKPAWVFLPLVPDWRWMLKRTDTPWYPSLRLFRQTHYKQWDEPIAQVVAALRDVH